MPAPTPPPFDPALRAAGRARPRIAVVAAGLVLALTAVLTAGSPAALGMGRAQAAAAAPDACAPTAELVNPCRPWLGAVADKYPGAGGFLGQLQAHERRIGRPVDVVHGYHPAGSVTISSDERAVVSRGSILYLNWKPADHWPDAAGGNTTVNAQIDRMAAQVKSLGPAKIMLGLFGEPERYVTPGTSACPGLHGTSGSPADYRAMWANVQGRFATDGVTNVVWVMNYLGYSGWDCLFPELWPGNDRVDWITWDPYIGPGERWDTNVGYFYDALTAKSDATHDYLSKPWGLAEFGYWYGSDQTEAYRMYDDALTSLRAGRFPRLDLYEPFDTISGTTDTRIGYTTAGVADPLEQQHYDAFADDAHFRDPAPTTTTVPATTTTTRPGATTTTTAVPSTTTTGPTTTTAPAGRDELAGCDPAVESGPSCFGGTYAAPVVPFVHDGDSAGPGTHSMQVTNTTAAPGTFGLNLKPAPVTATAVGRTYRAQVAVKAGRTGLVLHLLLRERRADGSSPGYVDVSWTATDTGWHTLSAQLTAHEPGNGLTESVYGSALPPGQWLRADSFVLTSS